MFENKKSTVKTAIIIIVITLIAKLLGLVRESMLAAYYGTGMMANAFLIASQIPSTFYDVVFESLISICFIPAFNTVFEKEGKENAFAFVNKFLTMVVLCTLTMTLVCNLCPVQIVRLFAPGFDGDTTDLAVQLLRIMLPLAVFSGLTFSLVAVLQSFNEFKLPAALSVVHNLLIIGYYLLLNDRFGIHGLAVVFMAGWAMQVVIQLPAIRKTGYRYRPNFRFTQDKTVRTMLKLVPAAMTSTWVQPINILVATRFASSMFQGTGSAYVGYANVLYRAISGILILSVTNIIFPALSRMAARNDKNSGFETVMTTLRVYLFFIIPLSAGVALFSEPLVQLIYQRGGFTPADTLLTGVALRFLVLGIGGYAVSSVLLRSFFSMQDGSAPLVCGIVTIGLNILLCWLLAKPMGLAGLLLACSVSSTVYALLLFLLFLRKHRGAPKVQAGLFLGKILVGSLVMSCCIALIHHLLWGFAATLIAKLMLLALCAVIGLILYLTACLLLKVPEAELALDFLKGKL